MGFSNNRYYTSPSKHICYCIQLNMVQLWDRISLWSRPITGTDHEKKFFWWPNLKIVIRWKLRWLVCTSIEIFFFNCVSGGNSIHLFSELYEDGVLKSSLRKKKKNHHKWIENSLSIKSSMVVFLKSKFCPLKVDQLLQYEWGRVLNPKVCAFYVCFDFSFKNILQKLVIQNTSKVPLQIIPSS